MLKNFAFYCSLLITVFIFAGCATGTDIPPSEAEIDNVSVNEENEELIEKEDKVEQEEEVEKVEKEEETIEVEQQDSALPKMSVHYIDVGQADATLLEFSDEEDSYTILIDTGNWNSSEVVSYLQSENISEIDIIAITHPHADHIGQLDKVIEAFEVSEVWMNGESTNSEVFARALEAIEANGVDYYEPEVGEVFDIGQLEIAVLHPNSPNGSTNNNSIAMRLQYGEISFLFTGDGEEQAENEILNRKTDLKADILHAGHHGSKTSTTESFLQAVDPEIAIYSAGLGNQYGHPNPEFINRINSNETQLYGTDIHGTILVETDGLTYTVQLNKQGTIPSTSAVPSEEEVVEVVEVVEESTPVSGESCVNINEATIEDIQRIIHIGTARAPLLIDGRPYSSVEDLDSINGIGPARIKDIIAQGIACIGG